LSNVKSKKLKIFFTPTDFIEFSKSKECYWIIDTERDLITITEKIGKGWRYYTVKLSNVFYVVEEVEEQ
jgi:hypothetical protein